ncbi:type II toxin-antitoxin system prevent-host-death family antitoxin [Acidaminobacter sp. JC074]|uniref:type II toxin-antitoxin system prevent-host-death family antitoxin n=1 Tax=Acidaminobacter sp. JC074 TaxID=2530199 RepID=UPI001F0E45CA|nr:type II toxin-antitoxin system prevent-host-death family antitoxin [Acidaminobacter sp. JC074]
MKTITATEFKKNLGSYLDAVKEKEEVYITKNNKKIARLAPIYTDAEEYFMVKEESAYYGNLTVSYEEFMEIAEKSEHRLEYLNGEIYQMASPSMTHQEVVGNIYFQFKLLFRDKKCKPFISPFDVHFWKKDIKSPDVLQPDVFIACDTDEKVNEKDRYMGIPTLVVEVLSPSTRSRDMVFKLNSYMLSGVEEYWVVDPVNKKVMVYNFVAYEALNVEIYTEGKIHSTMGFDIDFDELF